MPWAVDRTARSFTFHLSLGKRMFKRMILLSNNCCNNQIKWEFENSGIDYSFTQQISYYLNMKDAMTKKIYRYYFSFMSSSTFGFMDSLHRLIPQILDRLLLLVSNLQSRLQIQYLCQCIDESFSMVKPDIPQTQRHHHNYHPEI